jgi:hypothetical protein
MGTRINALLDHNLANFRDRNSVLERLAAALPGALAVKKYWETANPTEQHDTREEWRTAPESRHEPNMHRYDGPGSLFLSVTFNAARIHTGGRWRGFLSIEPLRRVHLEAFRSIARALESTCMALYADSCEIDDMFWGDKTQWECIEMMERMWGPPQQDLDQIDRNIAAAAERTVPKVWFLE